ncbi:MAG TPA: aminotransferase class V-fold PLP-dependent enzyme [Gemmatimonadaceae bacterium]
MNKRDFIRTAGGASLGLLLGDKLWAQYAAMPFERLAEDEAFWASIRAKYRLKPDYINLESGYYSIQSQPVLEAFIAKTREANYQGSFYYRGPRLPDKAAVAKKLAEMGGCAPEELIITRNTTESVDTVISGYDWKAGDEAVMAEQDYGHLLAQFKLMERRYGIVRKVVSVPGDPKSDDEVVQVYANAITPRTRLLMVCHMINVTGHILPVRKISDMAHARGVDVVIDGAHTFGHFDFKIPELGGDYYGASLHKWLGTPVGAGLLYVRRDKVKGLWPIFADGANYADDDILKLNHTGTHPVHTDLAISDAINFHNMIGTARKESRLRYLTQYWSTKLRGAHPKIVMYSPSDPKRFCGIGNVGIQGIKATDLQKTLLDKYKVWTVGVENDAGNVHGCRITPHVFIKPSELDTFVAAVKDIARTA